MSGVTIAQIDERLKQLPQEKLVVVYDFISYLAERNVAQAAIKPKSEAFQLMLASESVLARDWNLPEEDEAWTDL
jgi:hypothetical protein